MTMNPHKMLVRSLVILVFWLGGALALTVMAEPAAPATTDTLQMPVLPKGLEYEHRDWRNDADGPWSAHILKIARNTPDFSYAVTLARSTIFGLSPVSSQVKSVIDEGKPLAAINGDFFVIKLGPYRGDPIGLQITNGELVSGSSRPAFWFDPDGAPRIGDVQTVIEVDLGQGGPVKAGLNRQRSGRELVLYTPALGESTRTTDGLELLLDLANPADDEPEIDQSWAAKVAEISTSGGNTPLKDGQAVLSIGPELADKYASLAKGDAVSIKFMSKPDLNGVKQAIGGGPILMKDGQVVVDDDKVRHPRTAVGINADSIFWVVVDGRQPELSVGMSLPELAGLMRDLGCTDALNLDGGGSTTLWLEGRVMNSPSDGRERSVANALVLLQKNSDINPPADAAGNDK